MIKCVVFDFDGTLVDSNAIKRETFFAIVRQWDPSGEVVAEVFERWPAADRYQKTYKIAEALIAKDLLPVNSSLQKWSTHLAEEYTTQCERAISCCPEMPGASQTLSELLEAGFLLFVNSATPVEPLRKILGLRQWSQLFQYVYGAEDSKANNLKSIASRTATRPNEIVHVGDQFDDLLATEEFGCHFVAMSDANTRPVAKACPLYVQGLLDLPDVLKKLNQEAS